MFVHPSSAAPTPAREQMVCSDAYDAQADHEFSRIAAEFAHGPRRHEGRPGKQALVPNESAAGGSGNRAGSILSVAGALDLKMYGEPVKSETKPSGEIVPEKDTMDGRRNS